MPDAFHAQHAARGKLYEYRILNRPERPTIERRYVWHIYRPLHDAAMQQAASALIGSHDFSSFEGSLTDNDDPRCDLQRLTVSRRDHHLSIEACGDRFLKHMVRAIVGTLVEVGMGKRSPESITDVLNARDRSAAGQTAPPHGLFLVHVVYE
jgi:tRNA pseudouridine38-40 synthase